MATYTAPQNPWPIRYRTYNITAAEIVALGASATGTITTTIVVPAKAVILMAGARNAGTAAATLTTLTAGVGWSGNAVALLADQTVFAANAGTNRVPEWLESPSMTANTNISVLLTGSGNLSGLTSLTDGVTITIAYIEG